MAVPAEAPRHVVAAHGLVPGHDVLDGAGEDVAVVREPRGEGRAVVEDVLGEVLGALELGVEGLDVGPELEDPLLLAGEREVLPLGDVVHGGGREEGRERKYGGDRRIAADDGVERETACVGKKRF